MTSLLIRKFPDQEKLALKARAAHYKRSMEEEARKIMSAALKRYMLPAQVPSLMDRVRAIVDKHGGLTEPLVLPNRGNSRELPDFKNFDLAKSRNASRGKSHV